MIKSDFHMHSSFSGDSTTPAEDMIEAAIQKGMSAICFTEHLDLDFPEESGQDFSLDLKAYQKKNEQLQERYQDKLEILFGIELGLQKHLGPQFDAILDQYPFDFVIGSCHLVTGKDPCMESMFETDTEDAVYRRYFREMAENLKHLPRVDSCGHLDYIVRYGPNKNRYYSYERYREEIDEVLRVLINRQIALEINSAGLKYGLGNVHPVKEIIFRYKELGGELFTIGSDAHVPIHVGYEFEIVENMLKTWEVCYHTLFKNRNPVMNSL